MADVVLKQERLHKDKPSNWQPEFTIRRMLTYYEDPGNSRRLIFELREDGEDDTLTSGASRLDLDVRGDTEFFLRLDPDKDWFWSVKLDAITTKKRNDQFYRDILYERNGDFEEREDGEGWRTKAIRFLAVHNSAGPPARHGFSLNIDLVITDAVTLPITLDPDIRNPPPGEPVPPGLPPRAPLFAA
jgi:hypothetical protein